MDTIFSSYDLFCFDFDGLLVDTEPLHYESYLQALEKYGERPRLSFIDYQAAAHKSRADLERLLYTAMPTLKSKGPSFDRIREEKQKIYEKHLKTSPISLMEGAEELITLLHQQKKKLAIVTNSDRDHLNLIVAKIPILKSITCVITCEDTPNRKPAPDGYLLAMRNFPKIPSSRVAGFEDTYKGLLALKAAKISPFLVCSHQHPQLEQLKKDPSFTHITFLKELIS